MLVVLPPPLCATTAPRERTDGRTEAAAAILSVRCQYFPNVTGFLGVDRAISCFAGCREVSSASASVARRAVIIVVDAVRHTCHGWVQAESGKRTVDVGRRRRSCRRQRRRRRPASAATFAMLSSSRREKEKKKRKRIRTSSRRRGAGVRGAVAGNIGSGPSPPVLAIAIRFRSRVAIRRRVIQKRVTRSRSRSSAANFAGSTSDSDAGPGRSPPRSRLFSLFLSARLSLDA